MLHGLLRRSISVLAAAGLAFALAPAGASIAPVSAVTPSADLWVGISGPSTSAIDQTITYNLYFGDNGPDSATGVTLTNTFSSPVYFAFANTSSCSQTSPTTISCGPFTLSSGAGVGPSSIHLTIRPSAPGTLVDTLTGTAYESDPNPANNAASWSTIIPQPTTADVFAGKQVSPGPYYVGQTFKYYISYGSNGPANATNVVLTDQVPAQLQVVSVEAPCTASGNLVTCNLGTVWPNSVSDGIAVTVMPLSAGTVINTDNITATEPDPNMSNNSASVTVQIQPPTTDLAVTKTGTPNPVVAGQKETYTITVTNNGPSDATGVVAQDNWTAASGIKGGIAFKSVSTTQGTCTQSGAAITCDLGSLASGSTATVTLVLQPRSKGTLSDTATVSGNEYDPNTANNSSTVVTTVG